MPRRRAGTIKRRTGQYGAGNGQRVVGGNDLDAARAIIARRKAAVERYLRRFLDARLDAAGEIAPESRELLDGLSRFVLAGGKRIRAALVAAGYSCYALEPADDRLAAAGAAVELLHAFLLAHDDVFDRDSTRHGLPTLHRHFAAAVARRHAEADAARYGTSLAILGGDVAGMLAYEALAEAPVQADRLLRALLVLSRVAVETGYGEALDVMAEVAPDVGEERVLLIQRYKTAKYSFEGPLHIGAILAGAGTAELEALSGFAVPLGIAYQIQDDILGVFGSEGITGKPVGADLREAKRTLLLVHGLNGPHAASLRRLAGDPSLDAAAVAEGQRLLRDGGSLAYSEGRCAALLREATSALDRLEIRPEASEFLHGLTRLLVNRAA